jgi:hypothetical protein
MLYAILCYNSERLVGSWTKEEEDAVLAKRAVVKQKLAAHGKLGPVARRLRHARRGDRGGARHDGRQRRVRNSTAALVLGGSGVT